MIFGDVLSPYSHRKNENGTTDSICLNCFRTVGTSVSTTELQRVEWQHSCVSSASEPAVRDLALLSANLQYLHSSELQGWQPERHAPAGSNLFLLLDTIAFHRGDRPS